MAVRMDLYHLLPDRYLPVAARVAAAAAVCAMALPAMTQPASLSFGGLSVSNRAEVNIFYSIQPGDEVFDRKAISQGHIEDLNEDGQVNAVDVQLVINAALGL
jgi:hypothetical protein